MKKQAKQPKQLFRNRKPLTDKTKLVATIGLLIALIVFTVLPYILWNIPIIKAIVWGMVLVVLVDGLVYVLYFNRFAKSENEKKKEHEKYVEACKSLKNRVISFAKDLKIEREKRDIAISERDAISKEYDKLQNYKQTLKDIYMCSKSADTRAYAEECFKHADGLDLFQPIRYLQDQKYAMVIETHAEELLQLYRRENSYEFNSTYETRKRLNELLKKGGTAGAGGSSAPILTRERQTLKKIDNEYAR